MCRLIAVATTIWRDLLLDLSLVGCTVPARVRVGAVAEATQEEEPDDREHDDNGQDNAQDRADARTFTFFDDHIFVMVYVSHSPSSVLLARLADSGIRVAPQGLHA